MLLMLRFAMEPTLIVVFLFVVVIILVQNRAKERQSRLKVLEEALKNGNLDEATRQDLVDALSDRPRHRPRPEPQAAPQQAAATPSATPAVPPKRSRSARLLFAIGWLALFTGIALIAMDDHDTWEAGIMVAFSGFALMSLPIAVRELDREKPEKNGRRA